MSRQFKGGAVFCKIRRTVKGITRCNKHIVIRYILENKYERKGQGHAE